MENNKKPNIIDYILISAAIVLAFLLIIYIRNYDIEFSVKGDKTEIIYCIDIKEARHELKNKFSVGENVFLQDGGKSIGEISNVIYTENENGSHIDISVYISATAENENDCFIVGPLKVLIGSELSIGTKNVSASGTITTIEKR